jgi:ribosome biogenesis GTPase / thiamine phosphate phosphatase
MSHKLTKRQVRSIKRMMEHKGQHELRKERKAQQRLARTPRSGKPPRQRDWLEDEAAPSFEKIRRGRIELPAPPPGEAANADARAALTGTVIEVRSGDSLVSCEGAIVRAILSAGLHALDPSTRSRLAVGDRVQLEPIATDEARIVAVLPRRSALRRSVYDPSRDSAAFKGQVMAANIDQVVLVCSPAEPPFRPRLLDRYLVAAALDALPAIVCLNKCDLGVPAEVEASLVGYERLGVRVLRTSAERGRGIDELRACVAGGVSILTGHSGVGKSSLLNALESGLQLKVGTVTEATAGQGKGRHTTSSARLVPLSLRDTFVVDSPGIRSFGVRGLAPRELAALFPAIGSISERCAYRDCFHCNEPACAIEIAARGDPFLRERLESYRTVLGEL